jgi:hypothetical protein
MGRLDRVYRLQANPLAEMSKRVNHVVVVTLVDNDVASSLNDGVAARIGAAFFMTRGI